ncbi:hypothetical protein BBJ28_00010540 [Nothophytophthora sp. Chile5]|nr:hypothetical protein BBJ28_00010540 [Nothophytophthora sp. Chile5]
MHYHYSGCEFSFTAELTGVRGAWRVRVKNKNLAHNHEVSEELFLSCLTIRKPAVDNPVVEKVRFLLQSGATRREICELLCKNPSWRQCTEGAVKNLWTGKKSFGGLCLHHIDPSGAFQNPYLVRTPVISAIGRTLEAFDDDNIIPAFGFGDSVTKGDGAFSFTEGRKGCQGFDEVLKRYNALTPTLQLWGPTSFAPVIREAIKAVQEDPGYHILVIIADGQVNEPVATRQAIVEASRFPISIIMVGVGDGPWDMMEEFDDQLPARRFDNFQFVDYNTVLKRNLRNPEAGFAMQALMEIPGRR